ncbi:MAG: class I SAM-dependent methyltransferase [bacterium]
MEDEVYYFEDLLRAYVSQEAGVDCSRQALEEVLAVACSHRIDTRFLKRLSNPRIKKAVGVLKELWPKNLLDIGSGKGFFLWHLVEQLPEIEIVAVDILPRRVERINKVAVAAKLALKAQCCDGESLPFEDRSFDAVSMLEVLEHSPNPSKMVVETCRVSRLWVIASVPSKPDDNAEHIRVFDRKSLESMFSSAGAASTKIEQDSDHFYVLSKV